MSEDGAKDEPDRRPEQIVQAIVLSSSRARQGGTVADLFKTRQIYLRIKLCKTIRLDFREHILKYSSLFF